jgi:RecB family exonuclease
MNGQQPDGTFAVEKVEPKRPQLHASALEMKCMEAFRRRYIEGEIIPPGVAMIVGTGTHRSVELNLTEKIKTGSLLPIEAVIDAARDGVNSAWESSEIRLDPEEMIKGLKAVKGEAVDKAVRLSRLHATSKAPALSPKFVERKWSVELTGYPMDLVGTIDIQETTPIIRDTKTSGKTPPANCADRSLQLKAYALAVWRIDGEAPKKACLDYLIDTAKPKVETFESEPTREDFTVLLARIETLAMAMEKGVFIPVEPTHWCCDPKWCGYYQTCRYIRRPKQFAA